MVFLSLVARSAPPLFLILYVLAYVWSSVITSRTHQRDQWVCPPLSVGSQVYVWVLYKETRVSRLRLVVDVLCHLFVVDQS